MDETKHDYQNCLVKYFHDNKCTEQYDPSTQSSFLKRNEYKMKVENALLEIKSDIDALVELDKAFTDECNQYVIGEKDEYNKDYLELQRIVNKILE